MDRERPKHWKHTGSFRIKLRGGANNKNVPRNSFVGVVGGEICIIQGVAEKLVSRWEFEVKGDSFGWDDFDVGEVTADGKIVFDERGIFLGSIGGDK